MQQNCRMLCTTGSCHLPFGWDGEEVLQELGHSLSRQPGLLLLLLQVCKAEGAEIPAWSRAVWQS